MFCAALTHSSFDASSAVCRGCLRHSGMRHGFPPPWQAMVRDTRLILHNGQLFATWLSAYSHARPFMFSHIQLAQTASSATHGGGGRQQLNFRAWRGRRYRTFERWARGRNQVLFSSQQPDSRQDAASNQLLLQPFLHLVGELGAPTFRTRRAKDPLEPLHTNSTVLVSQVTNGADWLGRKEGDGSFGKLRSNHYNMTRLYDRLWRPLSGPVDLAASDPHGRHVARPMLSPTANPIHISTAWPGVAGAASHASGRGGSGGASGGVSSYGRCDAVLGIAHLHRGDYDALASWSQWRVGRRGRSRPPPPGRTFRFGSRYTHFLYALSPLPPYELLATSAEFCFSSAQDEEDCESIQFASGLAPSVETAPPSSTAPRRQPNEPAEVLVSFGINDCEARVGRLDMQTVWAMLRPLKGQAAPCKLVERA